MKKYTGVQQQIVKNVQKLHHLDKRNWQVGEKYQQSVQKSLSGCLHFISEEFGSAFCYDGKNGYIMTCAHCVVNEDDQYIDDINDANEQQVQEMKEQNPPLIKKRGRPKKINAPLPPLKKRPTFNLIFANGEIVECRLVKHSIDLDIAVLQIVQIDKIFDKIYPQVDILIEGDLKKCEELVCIGQPAYHDMESSKEGKTHYPPFYMSNGYFEGYTLDPIYGVKQKGLGPLKHSCWTYWGHSGSPIVNLEGKVIGMHNSWNDINGMRHGVSIHSIRQFQKLYPNLFISKDNNEENEVQPHKNQ